jgi:hypothetical protein
MDAKDSKEIHDYKLTTGNVEKLVSASTKLKDVAEKDPSMDEDGPTEKTIDDSVKRMEKYPKAVAAVKAAGLSPREFLVGTFALMNASVWSQMIKQYPQSAAKMPPEVNRDNLKFADQHPDLVQKWSQAWNSEKAKGKGKPSRDDDDDDAK